VARWALLFAALSPMVVALSRSIQPDITMLFAGTGALYFFYRYSETEKIKYYALSAVLLCFAVLTRIFALYFLLPIIYLAWEKERFDFLRNWKHYVYLVFVLLALLWYVYMWKMGQRLHLLYEPYRYSSATAGFKFLDFFRLKNLILPAKAVFLHLLTPLGVFLFCLGFFNRKPGRKIFGMWLMATLLYLLLLWRTAVIHPYYFLPLVPPMAFFIGCGVEWLRCFNSIGRWFKHPVILAMIALPICFNLFYYYRLLCFIPSERKAVVEAGEALNVLAPRNALVIAAYYTSPIQLYYCHRRGWAFDLGQGTQEDQVAQLEKLRQKGASFFVTTQFDALDRQPALKAYLSNFHSEKKSGRYEIWRLESKKNS